MSKEMIQALDALEQEKGVKKEVVIESKDRLVFTPVQISLMSCESTFSNPFGKLENYSVPVELKRIENGQWIHDQESEQLSLFEV